MIEPTFLACPALVGTADNNFVKIIMPHDLHSLREIEATGYGDLVTFGLLCSTDEEKAN